MQEGWDLKDDSVRLAIMNTTSETERVQALGRLRGDTEVLVYKVSGEEEADNFIDLPNKYFEEKLFGPDKDALCEDLGLEPNGSKMKWPTVKRLLERQGYYVKDGRTKVDGKQQRYSKIGF